MKTMNFLFAMVFAFLIGACTNETQTIEEELSSIDFKGKSQEKKENQEDEETQEVFALDLQQYHVLGQIGGLENLKNELQEEIEGGNKNRIPEMEGVMNQLQDTYDKLNAILDLTCYRLKKRRDILNDKLENATGEYYQTIFQELFDINEKIRNCGNDSKDYVAEVFEGQHIMYIMSWGSRCNPGREFKCKNLMKEGKLSINLEEDLAERTQVRFKTEGGEVLSNGKIIGNHEEFNGMVQLELELLSTERGILEISTESGILEISIEVK